MLAREDVDKLSAERRGPPGRDTGGLGSGPGEGERDEAPPVDLREGVLREDVLRERAEMVRGRMEVEAPNAEGGGEVALVGAGSSASVHCRCRMTDLVAHCSRC